MKSRAVLPAVLVAAASLATRCRRGLHLADYSIDVRLDAERKTLDGRQRMTWRNPSGDAVGEVWLHLYLNAFRNTESVLQGVGRSAAPRPHARGGLGLDRRHASLRRADGADLTSGMRFEHPDDDNAADRTVLRVPLPDPVPPGGEVSFDVAWKARLPRVFARTGYAHDYFLVGQWFPKLGVYEPAGLRGRAQGGWNCHQFHANSESTRTSASTACRSRCPRGSSSARPARGSRSGRTRTARPPTSSSRRTSSTSRGPRRPSSSTSRAPSTRRRT